MSYSSLRAALIARMQALLGADWRVEVGVREADLDVYASARVCLLVHDSNSHDSLDELGGTVQSGGMEWSTYLRVRFPRGREAEADTILQDALESLAALCGVTLDETSLYGPLERTGEENRSDDVEHATWRQGWYMPRCT